jgi:beta-phosphoglucomutase
MPSATDIGAIWDLDGTLADTEQAHFRAWQIFCRRYDRSVTWEEFKPTFGLGNSDVLRMLISPDIPEAELERMSDEKEAVFRSEAAGFVKFMPGARMLVDHLREIGVRQAIGSSAPAENIEFTLHALGATSLFDATVTRWEVAAGKPAPDIFLLAAEKLRIGASRCFVLEDAPPGIEAALAAGMRCVALAGTWPLSSLSAADYVVPDLSDACWDRQTLGAFVERTWNP